MRSGNMSRINQEIYNDMMNIISSREGELISDYISSSRIVRVRCNQGHEFNIYPNAIRVGTWCKICCNEDVQFQESEFYRIVQLRGGRALDEYTGHANRLRIECDNAHITYIMPRDIRQGKWCRECSHNSKDNARDKLIHLVTIRGGQLLDEYESTEKHVRIICQEGHIFSIRPHKLNAGQWCSQCMLNTKENGYNNLMKVINEKQGRLLSEYVNNHTKLQIQCKEGHVWSVTSKDVVGGDSWCPHCSRSKGESAIQEYLNKNRIQYWPEYSLLGNKIKYDFLVYYNNRYMLIEYDGIQHFEHIPFFSKTLEIHNSRLIADYNKTLEALNRGIPLLRITYLDKDKLEEWLDKFLNMNEHIGVIYSNEYMYDKAWRGVCY